MEQSARDRLAVEKSLVTARERLRALCAFLESGGTEVGVLRVAVLSALDAVDDAHSIVADPREAARIACPYCGYRIMSDATLCVSCWRKLDPNRTG